MKIFRTGIRDGCFNILFIFLDSVDQDGLGDYSYTTNKVVLSPPQFLLQTSSIVSYYTLTLPSAVYLCLRLKSAQYVTTFISASSTVGKYIFILDNNLYIQAGNPLKMCITLF